MSKIWFLLEDDQTEALEPLFDRLREDEEGKEGCILLQPYTDGLHDYVEVKGGYIPRKYGEEIKEILDRLIKDETK